MNEFELQVIEARAKAALLETEPNDETHVMETIRAGVEDLLPLIAEVRRLGSLVDEAFERGVEHGYNQCNLESSEREY